MVAHKLELLELLEFPMFFAMLPGKPIGIVGIVGIPEVFCDSRRDAHRNCWILGFVTGFLKNRWVYLREAVEGRGILGARGVDGLGGGCVRKREF